MDASIENAWKNGFSDQEVTIQRIEGFYNRKSISYIEKVIEGFKWEVYILIPASALCFLFNVLLGNDHALFWGMISSIPILMWFLLGRNQLKSLMKLDYQASAYDYLISIQSKLVSIRKFNRNLAITSAPILLFPMLLYTYLNQSGKTVGEIFNIDGLNHPSYYIFLLLPMITCLVAMIAQFHFKYVAAKTTLDLDALIIEIEELRK